MKISKIFLFVMMVALLSTAVTGYVFDVERNCIEEGPVSTFSKMNIKNFNVNCE